jgi:hypothetical protein
MFNLDYFGSQKSECTLALPDLAGSSDLTNRSRLVANPIAEGSCRFHLIFGTIYAHSIMGDLSFGGIENPIGMEELHP